MKEVPNNFIWRFILNLYLIFPAFLFILWMMEYTVCFLNLQMTWNGEGMQIFLETELELKMVLINWKILRTAGWTSISAEISSFPVTSSSWLNRNWRTWWMTWSAQINSVSVVSKTNVILECTEQSVFNTWQVEILLSAFPTQKRLQPNVMFSFSHHASGNI